MVTCTGGCACNDFQRTGVGVGDGQIVETVFVLDRCQCFLQFRHHEHHGRQPTDLAVVFADLCVDRVLLWNFLCIDQILSQRGHIDTRTRAQRVDDLLRIGFVGSANCAEVMLVPVELLLDVVLAVLGVAVVLIGVVAMMVYLYGFVS